VCGPETSSGRTSLAEARPVKTWDRISRSRDRTQDQHNCPRDTQRAGVQGRLLQVTSNAKPKYKNSYTSYKARQRRVTARLCNGNIRNKCRKCEESVRTSLVGWAQRRPFVSGESKGGMYYNRAPLRKKYCSVLLTENSFLLNSYSYLDQPNSGPMTKRSWLVFRRS
jgi:hypothetical protein